MLPMQPTVMDKFTTTHQQNIPITFQHKNSSS